MGASGVTRVGRVRIRIRSLAGQLVEGEVARVAIGISTYRTSLIGPEPILGASITGQDYSILADTLKLERTICKDHIPVICTAFDTVSIPAWTALRKYHWRRSVWRKFRLL